MKRSRLVQVMSFVNVFMVKDDSVFFVRVHYRELKNILREPRKYVAKLAPKFLDAGYVILDLNRKIVFDGQFGCHLKEDGEFIVLR